MHAFGAADQFCAHGGVGGPGLADPLLRVAQLLLAHRELCLELRMDLMGLFTRASIFSRTCSAAVSAASFAALQSVNAFTLDAAARVCGESVEAGLEIRHQRIALHAV